MKKVLVLIYTAFVLIFLSCAKERVKEDVKISNNCIISIQQNDGKEQSEIHFDKDVLTKKELQYFTKYSNGILEKRYKTNYEYLYDSTGLLTKVVARSDDGNYSYINFTYSNKKIISSKFRIYPAEWGYSDYSYNDKGQIDYIYSLYKSETYFPVLEIPSHLRFEYDSLGNPVRRYSGYSYYKRERGEYIKVSDSLIYEISYDDKINYIKYSLNNSIYDFDDFIGLAKNNVLEYKCYSYKYKENVSHYRFDYEYNANGLVTKCTKVDVLNPRNEPNIITFQYRCY